MATRPWRVIAQRVRTGEFLSWDVPLGESSTSRELSGPGGVFGTIDPAILDEVADDGFPLLDEWSTALYVEDDGQIRGGGIINKIETTGTRRAVEASGFSSYPTGIPYTDNYLPGSPKNPAKVYADLWEYVQGFKDGNLGVTVNVPETWMVLQSGDGPFQIHDYDYQDVGELLDQIASATPFDYTERHLWTPGHTAITHQIDLGFPRLGRKRDDLRFAGGENIIDFDHLDPDGENFATDVYLYGQGAGSAMMKSRASQPHPYKLRRCAVVQEPTRTGQTYLDRRARNELNARQMGLDVSQVTILDHPNARVSAIAPGDDILFENDVPYYGHVRLWLRVLAIEETGTLPGQAVLKTQRSDFFVYAPEKSPTGEKVPVSI